MKKNLSQVAFVHAVYHIRRTSKTGSEPSLQYRAWVLCAGVDLIKPSCRAEAAYLNQSCRDCTGRQFLLGTWFVVHRCHHWIKQCMPSTSAHSSLHGTFQDCERYLARS